MGVGRAIPEALRRGAVPPAASRMLPGLCDHRVEPDSTAGLFEDTWAVAPEADRIGYRFRGGRPLSFVARQPPFRSGSDPSNIVDS